MFAVIELGGNQYQVRTGDIIEVDSQKDTSPGSSLTLSPLLVSSDDGKEIYIGKPVLEDMPVQGKILEHIKGDKIRVFKMKSKKRYARTRGFRPSLSRIEITQIGSIAPAPKQKKTKQTDTVDTQRSIVS